MLRALNIFVLAEGEDAELAEASDHESPSKAEEHSSAEKAFPFHKPEQPTPARDGRGFKSVRIRVGRVGARHEALRPRRRGAEGRPARVHEPEEERRGRDDAQGQEHGLVGERLLGGPDRAHRRAARVPDLRTVLCERK